MQWRIDTPADLLRFMGKHKQPLRYASGGRGSIGHLAGEMFQTLTRTPLQDNFVHTLLALLWTLVLSLPWAALAWGNGYILQRLGAGVSPLVTAWGQALVQLSGTGVSAVNDQALVLFQSNYDYNVLMREGDAAPGCGNARIGVISRVEASTWFRGAAIVVSLTGATTTTDQALYSAILYAGNPTTQAILRRPILRLRKGQLFENQPGRVKSISLPSGSVTPWGAGGTGRGAGIAWGGQLAFVVEFENGVRQVVKGTLF